MSKKTEFNAWKEYNEKLRENASAVITYQGGACVLYLFPQDFSLLGWIGFWFKHVRFWR